MCVDVSVLLFAARKKRATLTWCQIAGSKGALLSKQRYCNTTDECCYCTFTGVAAATVSMPLAPVVAPASLYRIASATPSTVELSMLRCLRKLEPMTLNLSRWPASVELLENKHQSSASGKSCTRQHDKCRYLQYQRSVVDVGQIKDGHGSTIVQRSYVRRHTRNRSHQFMFHGCP